MSPVARAVVALSLLTVAPPVFAGCETDMDCKGDRVCEQGACVDPAPAAGPATPAFDARSASAPSARGLTDLQRLELRRARGKATVGYVGAGLTAALGAVTLATWEETGTAMAFGSAALLAASVTAPVAASGGSQARRVAREAGGYPPGAGLPVVAWIGYGLAVANGLGLIALAASDAEIDVALGASTVALGTVSTLGLAIDATTSASEVQRSLQLRTGMRRRPTLHVAPIAGMGGQGGRFGLAGTF